MRLLIATPIKPPSIGGPAIYAKRLSEAFTDLGHRVRVISYSWEKRLPSGIKHIAFMIKALLALSKADAVISLDPFIVGYPLMLANRIFRRPAIVRIGGDFLWEHYVTRTEDMLPLSEFYENHRPFTLKERMIFRLMRSALSMFDRVVFSTSWQKTIWLRPFLIPTERAFVIENYYAQKEPSTPFAAKNLIWTTRDIIVKNGERLKKAVSLVRREYPAIVLEEGAMAHRELMDRIRNCFAVILPSLSDVSPNLILEAVHFGKPFILTRETGLRDRLGEVGLFVDPLSAEDIAEKIKILCRPNGYQTYELKAKQFSFTHSYEDIAKEFLEMYERIKHRQ